MKKADFSDMSTFLCPNISRSYTKNAFKDNTHGEGKRTPLRHKKGEEWDDYLLAKQIGEP